MAFTYKGLQQIFRWIEPGSFLMGSSADEAERFDDEIQHEVTLSQGFWLADSTVTQALWEAVMGNNPSGFKGQSRPVEQISWQDTQQFIVKINAMQPALQLCLPNEAQWEYACRAGTNTPFYFGENITPQQVNYDGTEPYNKGKIGQYRKETVEVKSLPANDWGLYEMHGNVWEWCQDDWQAQLSVESVIDPVGPESGVRRVLRGGSWFGGGGGVRSAGRGDYSPGYRNFITGFRLARGHPEPV